MSNLPKEYFKIAIRNIRSRKLRSWLTVFGIVVGVFLVVTLISLSGGVKNAILKQLNALGGDVIFVLPGAIDNPMMTFLGGQELSEKDIRTIKKVEGVDIILPMSYKSKIMRYKEEQKSVFLTGIPWDEGIEVLSNFQGWSLAEGSWPRPGKRELIIGSVVAKEDFFGKRVKAGDEASIGGKTFKIVGILNSLGSKSDDTAVYLDRKIFQQITGEREGGAQSIMVKVEEGFSVDKVAKDIEEELEKVRKRKRGEEGSDFSVLTSEKMGGIVGQIMGLIELVVVILAGIAILVGGIGIMNSMFTAVRERTREIGVLKAIGAKNSGVISIILIESGIIGLAGGVGGIALGFMVAKLIEIYGNTQASFYLEAYLPISLIVFTLAFSFLIGCFAGYIPARQAAKLKPTEALRAYD